jgi:hypothetical protein
VVVLAAEVVVAAEVAAAVRLPAPRGPPAAPVVERRPVARALHGRAGQRLVARVEPPLARPARAPVSPAGGLAGKSTRTTAGKATRTTGKASTSTAGKSSKTTAGKTTRTTGKTSSSTAGKTGKTTKTTGKTTAGKTGKTTTGKTTAGKTTAGKTGGKTAGKSRKTLSPKVRNALRKRSLAKSFKGFKYRHWNKRWRTWLFFNPLDGGWYSFAPQTDAFIPAEFTAYDAPEQWDGDPEECPCATRAALQCPTLPEGDADVEAPEDPPEVPEELTGVNDPSDD